MKTSTQEDLDAFDAFKKRVAAEVKRIWVITPLDPETQRIFFDEWQEGMTITPPHITTCENLNIL